MTYHILCTFLLTEEYRAQEVRWSDWILRNGFDTTVVVCLVAADAFLFGDLKTRLYIQWAYLKSDRVALYAFKKNIQHLAAKKLSFGKTQQKIKWF